MSIILLSDCKFGELSIIKPFDTIQIDILLFDPLEIIYTDPRSFVTSPVIGQGGINEETVYPWIAQQSKSQRVHYINDNHR